MTIGNRVFISAGKIVIPNVTIGDEVIIEAGCVVNMTSHQISLLL